MTSKAYWNSFGRTETSQLFKLYLEEPILESSIKGRTDVLQMKVDTIYGEFYSFEEGNTISLKNSSFLSSKEAIDGKNSLFINGDEYALNHKISIKNVNHIYISAWVKNSNGIHMSLKNDEDFYALSHDIKENKKGWSKVQLLCEIPEKIESDSVQFFVWNSERNDYYFDELSIFGLFISKVKKHD